MSTNASQLASSIASGIGQGSPSSQVTGFAQGILQELTQNGIATFGGSPTGNTISGMSGSSMASKVASSAGYGSVSSELSAFCSSIVSHIQSAGVVTYSIGSSGGGTISGLSGSTLANLVKSSVGYPSVSSQLLGFCSAIANHINSNADVESGVIS